MTEQVANRLAVAAAIFVLLMGVGGLARLGFHLDEKLRADVRTAAALERLDYYVEHGRLPRPSLLTADLKPIPAPDPEICTEEQCEASLVSPHPFGHNVMKRDYQ